MIETLNQIDTQLFLFFNGMHCEFFDHFMKMFTMKFIWVPMYATILFVLIRMYDWRRALIFTLAIVLSIVLADQVCATFIRPEVERLRPSNPDNPLSAFVHIVDGYRGGSYGFPSCHGANSFALATILALVIRRRRIIMFAMAWAAINSYSRLYLGVHYPGDLLVGAIIGAACAALSYLIASTAIRLIPDMPEKIQREISLSVPVGINIENSLIRIVTATLRISDILIIAGILTVLVIVAASV